VQNRIPFIDFAKAFTILLIALYHYSIPLSSSHLFQLAINFGGTGIHLFFFLSGLGLGLSKYYSAGDFYKRRVIRILTPYYLFITLVFLFNLILPVYPASGLKEYLSHIFLYKMFSNQTIGSFGYHLWFISTLIQLYLFFPLFRKMMSGKYGALWVIVLMITSVAYNAAIVQLGHASERSWNSFFVAYAWEFALGLLLGMKQDTRLFRLPVWLYLMMWCGGLALMALLTVKLGQAGRLMNDIPAFFAITGFVLLVFHLLDKLPFLHPLKNFFIHQSNISFDFYLVHYLGFSLLMRFGPLFNISYAWWMLPFIVLFSWGLAHAFNAVIAGVLKNKPYGPG
jgi:peptidoglycan/LPS O-acetylase OafA/YrhL